MVNISTNRYKKRLSKLSEDIREHIWWRWRRLRMHPKYRGAYTKTIQVRRVIDPDRYTDADPFKIIYVDPNKIRERALDLPVAWGQVVGGNWERGALENTSRYRALEQRFIENKSWEEVPHEFNDAEVWDQIYRSIKENGYKTQEELRHSKQNTGLTWDCEVGVAIDQNGEILWHIRGAHRVRVAKLMDIDKIPVQIRVRHAQWQTIRDKIGKSTSVSELSERARDHLVHPDIQDVSNF